MRFNCHCHVFNLQSIFNPSTAYILAKRLEDAGLTSDFAAQIVHRLERFMKTQGGFDSVGSDPGDFSSAWTNTLLGKAKVFWEALHVAMLKDMDKVTDDMMNQLHKDVAFVPLMMDILVAHQTGRDPLFESQLEGTKRQIIRHPGRILPFYAVNPFREGFVEKAKDNLLRGGFVGVKLYPSLGYDLSAPGMTEILSFCAEHGYPLLMHCNRGGFKQDDSATRNCDPALWGLVDVGDGFLDTHPDLKICFGHFGGAENFLTPDVFDPNHWTGLILQLMKAYPDRVFADVSYHDTALSPSTGTAYFASLAAILADPDCRSQVLWGTDTWLLRMNCQEVDYWSGFMFSAAIQDNFSLMCSHNPRVFLGIDPNEPGENIVNHLAFLQAHAHWSQEDAASWLNQA
ncbi:hypothetical protein JCM15519_10290 [Fundidesulfovibrio butyratiphilus]